MTNKQHLEKICADLQAGIRQAKDRGEDTKELEAELSQALDTLIVWSLVKH